MYFCIFFKYVKVTRVEIMTKKILLIDAMGLIFRAYYAMIRSPRYTSKGLNTSAILGFTNSLYDVLKSEKPTHVAVAFDTGAPTFRHAEYDHYKENREATPEDIVLSLPYIKKILSAFRIKTIGIDGYEADDVIGSLAKHAEIEGFDVLMMTSDKDYGQLVSEHIKMYRPGKFGQPAEILGVNEICEKYKINHPEQLIDMLGLWGDSSDNIPGVPGIGQVKAQKLISNYGSMEAMYERNFDLDNEKTRTLMNTHREKAFLSKQLATIMIDVPMSYDFNEMAYKTPNVPELKNVFDELEFKSLAKRIFTELSLQNSQIAPIDLFSVIEPEKSSKVEFEIPEIKEVKMFSEIKQLPAKSTIFFDWIFVDKKISGFAFAFDEDKIYSHFVENKERNYRDFISEFFGKDNTVVMHDCKDTFKYLKSFHVNPECEFWDIKIAHYLIQPERKHDIFDIAWDYFHYEPSDNNDNKTGEKLLLISKIYSKISEELKINNLQNLFKEIEMPLVPVLAEMEYSGVKIDTEALQKNSENISLELKNLESKIFEYAGENFNLASPRQLGEILFGKLQIVQNAKLTKSRQFQTGEEVLKKLIHKHPIIPLILEWRQLSKLKSTYISALPQLINPKTGRIHTTYTQTITTTGRLSSVNPNLQNIPIRTERGRDIRKAFVPSEGNILLAADYSQIELRIVAHICKDERMINTFIKNEDIHSSMAAHIFNVDIDKVTPDMRRAAKTVNFGILYGMSAFGLADRLQISQYEARNLISEYFKSFPKISDYLNETLDFARKHEYVETLMKRRRNIRDINSKNAILRAAAERNAINAPIQGTAADLIKIAMVNVYADMQAKSFKSKMILQVHDELVFDVFPDELEMLTKIVLNNMTTAMKLDVPLDVNVKSGENWFVTH